MTPTKKLLNIRISQELKKAAKKIAVEDGRSLSNWVNHLIEIEVKNAGNEHARMSKSKSDLNTS